MVDEDTIKDTLSKWLIQFNCQVLWEKKNSFGYPLFKRFLKSSITQKPDLIVLHNGYAYAVEVKNAENTSGMVFDAVNQIVKYASNDLIWMREDNHNKLIISGYLIATQYSLQGHLLKKEYETLHQSSSHHQWAIMHGQIPKNEYTGTKIITRLLWRNAEEKGFNKLIGVLLSNSLNDSNSCAPLIQYKEDKNQSWDVWL